MLFRDRLPRQRTQPTERFPVTSGNGQPPSRSMPTDMNEMLQRMAAAKRAAMARGETPASNPRSPRIQPMPGRERRITMPMQPLPLGNGAPGPGGPSNQGAMSNMMGNRASMYRKFLGGN